MGMFEYSSLGIGAAAGIVATVRLAKSPPLKVVVVGYLAALLFLGFGQYGIPFLANFSDFVDGIAKLVKEPSEATYSEFLDKAAKGEISDDARRAGMTLMLENPVPNLPAMLERAAGKAASEPIRREITTARQRYEATIELNRELTKDPGRVSETGRAAAAIPLRNLPATELEKLQIDPKKLEATKKNVPWLAVPLDRRR
ncbi:MAG: hypothetical protein KDE27_30370 [Planctomycetes bacterium]|nr:hypothetical protein [Planctomycetota bacterium]